MATTMTSPKPEQSHVTVETIIMGAPPENPRIPKRLMAFIQKWRNHLTNFSKFVGPGFMIAVAYIDPGNYATNVAAGSSYRFKLLFIVMMSNVIAIYLQSLCIKLGSVSGMDLAQMCRAHFPRWLNYFLYVLAEGSIIATDIAEVIGVAIAINLLIPQIPLVAGCAISIIDVLLILMFYHPNGTMKGLRGFEFFVIGLVLAVVILFGVQLSHIKNTPLSEVLNGYLPSNAVLEPLGLYQACGILGATVVPHGLYLGSGIVQPRLIDYDLKNGHIAAKPKELSGRPGSYSSTKQRYQPSLDAVKFCLKYSVVELGIAVFVFALFVNSAILIVAGASFYNLPPTSGVFSGSLFVVHKLLSTTIAPIAGTIFALALLLSSLSAGIVCTIAGQMVSEGAINWTIAPWLRRFITRCITIIPSIIIASAVGQGGLTAALHGSQVALSIALPFISAPVIYFTCRNKFMTVKTGAARQRQMEVFEMENNGDGLGGGLSNVTDIGAGETALPEEPGVSMRNSKKTTIVAIIMWLVIALMNVANLIFLGAGM